MELKTLPMQADDELLQNADAVQPSVLDVKGDESGGRWRPTRTCAKAILRLLVTVALIGLLVFLFWNYIYDGIVKWTDDLGIDAKNPLHMLAWGAASFFLLFAWPFPVGGIWWALLTGFLFNYQGLICVLIVTILSHYVLFLEGRWLQKSKKLSQGAMDRFMRTVLICVDKKRVYRFLEQIRVAIELRPVLMTVLWGAFITHQLCGFILGNQTNVELRPYMIGVTLTSIATFTPFVIIGAQSRDLDEALKGNNVASTVVLIVAIVFLVIFMGLVAKAGPKLLERTARKASEARSSMASAPLDPMPIPVGDEGRVNAEEAPKGPSRSLREAEEEIPTVVQLETRMEPLD